MKISIVTISFNQAKFIRQCIDSVLSQDGVELDYIVVDPGSKDGSREIVREYGDKIKAVFEPDSGPADGLTKGFALAEGQIFGFLNSDDVFQPGALREICRAFADGGADVCHGHGYVLGPSGEVLRKVFSDRFSLLGAAYGASILIQPSTFFTREIYFRSPGFNSDNRTNWDGELFVEFSLSGARFKRINKFMSGYRIHQESITGSARLTEGIRKYQRGMFERIVGRKWIPIFDDFVASIFRMRRKVLNPRDFLERIFRGRVYGRKL